MLKHNTRGKHSVREMVVWGTWGELTGASLMVVSKGRGAAVLGHAAPLDCVWRGTFYKGL